METSLPIPSRIKKKVNDLQLFVDGIQCLNSRMTINRTPRKIVALGDIHGDFEALIYALFGSGVISRDGTWKGGDTVVVQTGDIFDDCRIANVESDECINPFDVDGFDEIIILDYLGDLNRQAKLVGGEILICMGNHDYMNIVGDPFYEKYVQPITKNTWGMRRREFLRPGGPLAQKLACMMNVVHFVGDWVFMHGGLRPSSFETYEDIFAADQFLKLYLLGELTSMEVRELRRNIDNHWFFWDRTFSQNDMEPDDGAICQEFLKIREMLDNPNLRMVVGHTTQNFINGICNDHEGKPMIYRIDTKMSRAFGAKKNPTDRIQTLVIRNGEQVVIQEPIRPSVGMHVPDSKRYVEISKKRGLPISSNYTPLKKVTSKRGIRKEEYDAQQEFLENQENADLDEAFLFA